MKDPKGPVKPYRSPKEIAKKHKVPLDKIMNQVKMGTKVEGEHTTSKSGAKITALQHVDELPDYYSRLKKVEKSKPVKEESSVEDQYEEDTKYCLLCRKNEKKQECSWGPQMWDRYTIAKIHPTNESKINEDHKEIDSGKKKDDEGYMARIEFDQIERSVNILRKLVKKGDQQLPAWVQSKITRAADFIDTAAEYLSSDEGVSEDFVLEKKKGLWDNIHARRKKGLPPKKPGQEGYPKTLNVEGVKSYEEFMTEVAAWQRKEGKNREGGLNEKGRKSYERENPGSDLKAPSKKVGNSRRASFCARMSGMKKKLTSKKTANDPNSRINKSLRAWNC
jgi:hypothetical protein